MPDNTDEILEELEGRSGGKYLATLLRLVRASASKGDVRKVEDAVDKLADRMSAVEGCVSAAATNAQVAKKQAFKNKEILDRNSGRDKVVYWVIGIIATILTGAVITLISRIGL